jgi:hypothetical protein
VFAICKNIIVVLLFLLLVIIGYKTGFLINIFVYVNYVYIHIYMNAIIMCMINIQDYYEA